MVKPIDCAKYRDRGFFLIEGIVGLPGQGKTLFAVWMLLQARAKRRRAVANFHSTRDLWEYGLWADMVEQDNCLCVIDEAHMWFSARTWANQKQADLAVFQQHRKNGLDLVWIAQHENRVDVAIREVTAWVWRVNRVGPMIWCRRCSLDERDKVFERKIIRIHPDLYSTYDTFEVIGDRAGVGARAGKAVRPDTREPLPASPVVGERFRRFEIFGHIFYLERNDPRVQEFSRLQSAALTGAPFDPLVLRNLGRKT